MKIIIERKVYYSDTDAYAVVWHGSYLRWLEAGRVEFCEQMGYNLVTLKEQNIVMPVVNLNVRYKASAKLNDVVIIETEIEKFNFISVTFKQKVKSKDGKKTFIDATVDVVAVDNGGKLYRKMPKILTEEFKKTMSMD